MNNPYSEELNEILASLSRFTTGRNPSWIKKATQAYIEGNCDLRLRKLFQLNTLDTIEPEQVSNVLTDDMDYSDMVETLRLCADRLAEKGWLEESRKRLAALNDQSVARLFGLDNASVHNDVMRAQARTIAELQEEIRGYKRIGEKAVKEAVNGYAGVIGPEQAKVIAGKALARGVFADGGIMQKDNRNMYDYQVKSVELALDKDALKDRIEGNWPVMTPEEAKAAADRHIAHQVLGIDWTKETAKAPTIHSFDKYRRMYGTEAYVQDPKAERIAAKLEQHQEAERVALVAERERDELKGGIMAITRGVCGG